MKFEHGLLKPGPIGHGYVRMGAIQTLRCAHELRVYCAMHINAPDTKAPQTPGRVIHPDGIQAVDNFKGRNTSFPAHRHNIALLRHDGQGVPVHLLVRIMSCELPSARIKYREHNLSI